MRVVKNNTLAWVRVNASAAGAAESMLWEVLATVLDGEACGAGFPLPIDISPSLVEAAKALEEVWTGSAAERQVAVEVSMGSVEAEREPAPAGRAWAA